MIELYELYLLDSLQNDRFSIFSIKVKSHFVLASTQKREVTFSV